MNAIHLHLLLNHLPVIGAVIALLLLAVALVRRSDELLRAALALYVLIGIAALAVFLTGEPAEEAIERLPGFPEVLVERHEELALVSTIAMGIAGLAALVALIVHRRRRLPRWIAGGGVLVGASIVVLVGYTANLGGQIRHPEIRAGGAPAGRVESQAAGDVRDDD